MNSLLPLGRRRASVRRALLATSTILAAGIIVPAAAQLTPPAPVRQSVDANGVDLFAGTLSVKGPAVSAGGGRGHGLSYYPINTGSGWTDNITAALDQSGSTVTVRLGGSTDQFTASGGTFTATQGNGATLTQSGSTYTYTSANGTVVHFAGSKSSAAPYYASLGRAIDIVRPSGMKLVYDYQQTEICTRSKPGGAGQICMTHGYIYRLSSVTNSYGYAIILQYQSDETGQDEDSGACCLNLGPWSTVAGASVVNTKNYGAGSASETIAGGSTKTVTDALNRTTSYRMTSDQLRVAGITRPGSGSENVTIGYDGSNRVSSVATAAGTWIYGTTDPGDGTRHVSVTDPSNATTAYVFSLASQRMTSMTDALGRTSSWSYDGSGRLQTATAPEQNSVTYTYDARGNVTDTTYTPMPGSGQSAIATHAGYDATCGNALTCNQPNTTTDANGNVTHYYYDPTHGGVTRVTAPAGANGVTPEVRYGYGSYTDNFGGTIWKQTTSSACRTAGPSGCIGGADEVVTSTDFGSLAGNNFLPLSTTRRAGDNSVSATVSMGYDGLGNMVSTTDPMGAVTQMRYDALRRPVETISPDPDGGGPMKSRATATDYNLDGTVASQQVGTDTGSGFQSLQRIEIGYDAALRPIRQSMSAGGTTYSVVDTAYDVANRLTCTTVRMNPAAFGAQPDACALGSQGSDGPDRITVTRYDQLGRVGEVDTGWGTAVMAIASRTFYSANGQVASQVDANNNQTNYTYDGFDRLSQTFYPVPTTGAMNTNGNDYEQLSYDAGGNVTDHRLRDGQHVTYGYDALNRMTSDSQGHSYSYDNLSQLTLATDTNSAATTFGYDALGRKTSQGNPFGGTATMQYDAAGRRTRLTWADGFYVTYDYDPLGEMTGIHENGGTVLASFGYDDLGRRTAIGRANGASTTYSYDAARLIGLTLNGAPANSYTFGYNAAGQITSRTSSNDAYAWAPGANGTKSYAVNGLNQYTQAGGVTPTYDGRGNTTGAGGGAYGYNLDNQLTGYPGGTIYRTALGQWLDASTEQRWMVYDGDRTIEEYGYDQTVKRRYVYGPGSDEPLVWYEGAGTSDRRFLHADERGSVVAVTDAAGSLSAINTYDEYGNPGAGNVGRFGYTGQRWLPAAGLWDYKVRMYSPSLGRFMQTDPIGYADGMNWYSYTHGDPVNGSDPSGTFGIFGGCPASSSCTSTNPAASNAEAAKDWLKARGATEEIASTAVGLFQNYPLKTALATAGVIDEQRQTYTGNAGAAPQSNDPPGTIFVTYYGNRGPTFGIMDQFNYNRGVMSHVVGGYDQAKRDLDELADWNGQTPLGNKGLVNGPPAGWFIAPISNGIRIFNSSGLQMRVTPGNIRIDIPAGFRVGPTFADVSNFGETVHYGR